ncbi:hypothetical protein MEM_04508 [Candida albicans L26]|nr:hypothetical protein MG9_04523 [Candida albicans P37037]KGT65922.1 hypothetical protein MEK_04535 [Candida albicans 12C]KGU05819.1 hypothetical protein MEM_04508 [Candida albicans L26]KGU22491.1 hypothetical protein MG7_04522 [Candida albicans P34048]KGU25595.1 hypothetical protein MGK_04530 [Candida albicans P57055]KHC71514.1 hypothetical protein MGS_04546 [Candida albicans P78042]
MPFNLIILKFKKMVFEEICVCVKDKLDLKYIYLF